jgi:signal transduction histidine kinase
MNYLFNFFQLKAFKKRLEFKIDIQLDDNSHIINTDKYLLEGILTNLINNAIKYTERGFVKVGCHSGESGKVIFSVKDSGLGIEKVRQAAIFDRFVQANLEHIRSIEGSGLGLSIVKSYVDKLDGEIWLESEPNVGSSFFFSIPG